MACLILWIGQHSHGYICGVQPKMPVSLTVSQFLTERQECANVGLVFIFCGHFIWIDECGLFDWPRDVQYGHRGWFWGTGLALCSVLFWWEKGSDIGTLLPVILVCLWAFRLSTFLFLTRISKGEKDERYTKLQQKWGKTATINTLGNFYLQAALQCCLLTVLYPVFLNEPAQLQIPFLKEAALLLFSVALAGQTMADWQLYRFKRSTVRRLSSGLMGAFSSPHYFFEVLIWVSLAIYSTAYSQPWVALISPITIWVIVRWVTGPYSERLSLAKRPIDYAKYQNDAHVGAQYY